MDNREAGASPKCFRYDNQALRQAGVFNEV